MGFFDFLFKKKEDLSANEALQNIEVEKGFFLPKAFAEHWAAIKNTGIEYIEIKATPATNITKTESNFGGHPFIPVGFNYPVDKRGNPMIPIAQLNFSETPRLKDYPDKGLLQFYIADYDSYGLDFNNQYNPDTFRVIFIEDPEALKMNPDTSFIDTLLQSENSPVFKPHRLSFTKKVDYIGREDYRHNLHGFDIDTWIENYPENIKHKLEDLSYELFSTNGHKIGGYAYFTQTDPRDHNTNSNNNLLLFQLDSDDEIMWGDVGVGNFFIDQNDLINKNFSKVMYNWDCC